MKELFSTVVLAAVISVATPVVVLAQAQYPPPVPTPTSDGGDAEVCFTVEGDVDGRPVRGRVDHGSDIAVAGSAGTAEANGEVDLFVDGGRAALGKSRALEDGSFALTLSLPAWVKPGHHRIIGVIEGCGEGSVDLEVLGTSLEAAVGDSGVLPRTGISILSYILSALMLLGIGALLLTGRSRRAAIDSRTVTGAPSEASVALLDTSDFVPRRSGKRSR